MFNIKHLKCPKCLDHADISNWLPSRGIDPNLHKFACPHCHSEFYAILSPAKPEQPVFPTFASR